MNECLLIIDPQKDFTAPNGFYASRHAISRIIETKRNINKLLRMINNSVQVIIVYSDYYSNQFGDNISMCIPGTEGHEIDIDKNDSYIYFSKNEHSAFSSSDLKHYMQCNDIKRIYLAGFLAEYCIRKTAIDAVNNNFNVTLLRDCIGTGDDVVHQNDIIFRDIINSYCHVSDYKDCFKT